MLPGWGVAWSSSTPAVMGPALHAESSRATPIQAARAPRRVPRTARLMRRLYEGPGERIVGGSQVPPRFPVALPPEPAGPVGPDHPAGEPDQTEPGRGPEHLWDHESQARHDPDQHDEQQHQSEASRL